MKVHQLSVTYLREQDRLLTRINTSEAEELRLWFTRRLMLELWPTMHKVLTDQLVSLESSITSGVAADEDMKQMLADFRKQEFLQEADFDTPYKEQQARLPLGEEPLLVTDLTISHLAGSMVALEFHENPPGADNPRSFRLELDPALMQGFVHLVDQALTQASWTLPPRPRDAATAPADKPRYLN
jgi:hypothetical protein